MAGHQDPQPQPIIQYWSASVEELFYTHAIADASNNFLPIFTYEEPVDSPAQVSHFMSLPEDIVICVLAHCGWRELIACIAVCQTLRTLIQSDTYLLRCQILLAANGMVAGPSSHDNKLDMLLEHCSRIANGTYSCSGRRHVSRISVIDEDRLFVLLFGGTITYVVLKPNEDVIEIHEPPLLPGHCTGKCWFVPMALFPEGRIWMASADTTQDLLLVVQHLRNGRTDWVHVRSLSDPSARHPNALAPILHTAASARQFDTLYSIQIHRQHVAWGLFSDAKVVGSRIEVWDWQNGLFVWRCDFAEKVSFTLLDLRHVVVAGNYWDYLLGLPFRRLRLQIQESSIPAPPVDAPFWPDPELRTIVLAYSHSRNGRRNGGIFIPYTTFVHWLNHIPMLDATLSSYRTHIEWEQWGPSGSILLGRPFGLHSSSIDHIYSYGSRISFLAYGRDGPQHSDVLTIDLNPYGPKFAGNPYVTIPPHLSGPVSDEARAWTSHVQIPHTVHASYREEQDFELWHPSIIAHPYGYTELFFPDADKPDAPPSQQVGFRWHCLSNA